MAKKRLNPLVKRSRTRLGCLTCRDRHMKCDEQQPVCKNCIKLKRKCYRGVRLNFTQYTYFNPHDDSAVAAAIAPAPAPQQHPYRILDQLITIALLYRHGRRQYRPYLHLHSPQELDEAERTFHDGAGAGAGRDALVSAATTTDPTTTFITTDPLLSIPAPPPPLLIPPAHPGHLPVDSPHLYSPHPLTAPLASVPAQAPAPLAPVAPAPLTAPAPPQISTTLPERYDIALALLKPMLPSATPFPPPAPQILSEVAVFIDIVERQRYHWFLDQFNELGIWGLMIPHRCFAAEYSDRRPYLYLALLACSLTHSPDLSPVVEAQLAQIAEFHRATDIGHTERAQRTLLEVVILIVLVLCGIAGRDHLLPYLRAVCYNQGQLYDALASPVAAACADSIAAGSDAIVWALAVQLVTILKYFIGKKFQLAPPVARAGIAAYPAGLDVPIPPPMMALVFYLNQFEVAELNLGFARAQFPQLSQSSRGSVAGLLDLLKLRQLVWHLIKLEYVTHNPQDGFRFDLTPPIDLQREQLPTLGESPTHQPIVHTFALPQLLGIDEYYPPPSVLANPKGIAINLLREHAIATTHAHDPHVIRDCRYRGQFVMRMIDELSMDPNTKAKWHGYFDWTIR